MDIAFGSYGLTAKADASGVDLKVYVKNKNINCRKLPVNSDINKRSCLGIIEKVCYFYKRIIEKVCYSCG